jgi:hypothetical protein
MNDEKMRNIIREILSDKTILQEGFMSFMLGNKQKQDKYFAPDWYEAWYAAIDFCIKSAIVLGFEPDFDGNPTYFNIDELITSFSNSTSHLKRQSLGWADGVSDCIDLLKTLNTKYGNVLKISLLKKELEFIKKRPSYRR